MIAAMRVADWRKRLLGVVSSRPKEFIYGQSDCCVGLAFPVIEAVIGLDLSTSYRGQYATAQGGVRLFKRHGFDPFINFFADKFESVLLAQSRIGDLSAFLNEDGNWAMAVVLPGALGALSEDGRGLVIVELRKGYKFFKIGDIPQ